MKTASDLLENISEPASTGNSQPTTSTSTTDLGYQARSQNQAPLTELESKGINYFFGRLKRAYGANFKVKFPSVEEENSAKQSWANHIRHLNRAQIDAGFIRMQQLMVDEPDKWRWPEVARTIHLCKPRPEDYGMPPEDRACQEVEKHSHEPLEHNWSHRGVYIACHYTGWFDIRNEEHPIRRNDLRKKFRMEYQRIVMRIFTTGNLEPPQALENQNTELTTAEKARQHNEQQLQKTMERQGINPRSGRNQYLQRMKDLGILTEKQP